MAKAWTPPYLREVGIANVHQRPLVMNAAKKPLGRMDVRTAWGTYPRVEIQPPNEYVALGVDVDRRCYEEIENLDPLPSWAVEAHPSRKRHYVYALANPVHNNPQSLSGPLAKLADVADRLTLLVGGDPGYTGRIVRNPLEPGPFCEAHFYRMLPYTLEELDAALPKRKRGWRLQRETGLGRNVDTFAHCVKEAHRPRWGGASYEAFLDYVRAWNLERWDPFPLPDAECRSIAKSCWKYRLRQFDPARFAEIQTRRIAKRWHGEYGFDFDERDLSIDSMTGLGFKQKEIAEVVGLSTRQVRRIQKRTYHNSVLVDVDRIDELATQGLTEPAIAEIVGLSRPQVHRRLVRTR